MDKQVNRQQQHCKDQCKQNTQITINNLFGRDILFQVHSSDCLPSDIKGLTTAIQKEFSQACVKTHCEEINCSLKIPVIKI